MPSIVYRFQRRNSRRQWVTQQVFDFDSLDLLAPQFDLYVGKRPGVFRACHVRRPTARDLRHAVVICKGAIII